MEAVVNIEDVYRITGIGNVPVGTVTSGTLVVGMRTRLEDGSVAKVKSIEENHKSVNQAGEGARIGFNLVGGSTNVVKRLGGRTITFSDTIKDSRSAAARSPQGPNPSRPEGVFSWVGRLLSRR